MKFIPPSFYLPSFNCPNCSVYASQTWSDQGIQCFYTIKLPSGSTTNSNFRLDGIVVAKCAHCELFSIWLGEKMIFPLTGNIEDPNEELPEDIKNDYLEARNIVNISPRGSAALLRLAVQKLCIHLGEKGENINEDISNLVSKGLPKTMQKALDSVRVIGNNAVHPGKIDLKDDFDVAYQLFGFINIICEVLIRQPKKIDDFYTKHIPASTRKSIESRDSKEK